MLFSSNTLVTLSVFCGHVMGVFFVCVCFFPFIVRLIFVLSVLCAVNSPRSSRMSKNRDGTDTDKTARGFLALRTGLTVQPWPRSYLVRVPGDPLMALDER